MLRFENDYSEGTYPEILAQLAATNFTPSPTYGLDPLCEEAEGLLLALCGLTHEDAKVHFIPGGTLTNLTLLSAALRPHQGVIAAVSGHISTHESGAIEATGHKVLTLPSGDGKLTAAAIAESMEAFAGDPTREHQVHPAVVYISDLTEMGTSYTREELYAISKICRDYRLRLFLDGARLGYALCAADSDKTLADVATCCDAFTFGGTKIGALFGEALVLRDPAMQNDFRTILKQKGGLLAKGWLLGLQFTTLLTNELYRSYCMHANQMADHIRNAVRMAGYEFLAETTGNQVFPILPKSLLAELDRDFTYSYWEKIDEERTAVRFCTSWASRETDVEQLCEFILRGKKVVE